MTQYLAIDATTGHVLHGVGSPSSEDFTGPPSPAPEDTEDVVYRAWQGKIDFGGGAGVLAWEEGATEPTWRDERTLAEAIAESVHRIDAAADIARARILAFPTNAEEYHPAAEHAAAYQAAGFTGPVPRGVSGWTHAKRRKGWTDQQAAEDILATAERWDNAKWFIRDHRLDMKELARDATTNHEADLVLETFIDGLTAAMQGVQ